MNLPAATPHHGTTTHRILVADPDHETRLVYRESFLATGCDVMEASDGREALAKALTGEPALVLTELALPLLDGYALCDILRKDRVTATVPILVVTSEARSAAIDRALSAGADVVLVKPTPFENVVREMEQLLTRSRELRGQSKARQTLKASHERFKTRTPPALPPPLTCPSCDHPLTYDTSAIGGVNERFAEQWDYYHCDRCEGRYQYRQRTRSLRARY
jgi:CheY-like chemotaxis protein